MPEHDKELTELINRAEMLCIGDLMPSRNQSNAYHLVRMLNKGGPYLIGEGRKETMTRLKDILDEGEAAYAKK